MSPLVVFYGIGLLVVVAVIVLAVTLGRRANHREGFSSARERTLEAQHRRARMDAGGVDRAERGGVQGGVYSGPVREPASQTAGKIGSVLIAYIDESYDRDAYFIGAAVANEVGVPDVSDRVRQQIIDAGKSILDARALHPERSLADHYNPLAMSPALTKAHDALDRAVDRAFGARGVLHTEEERQRILFKRYAELTGVTE